MYQTILKGAKISLILKCCSALFGFLFNYYVVTLLGAEDGGIFFISLSLIMIVSVFSRLGVDQVIIKEVSILNSNSDDENIDLLFKFIMVTVLISSTVMASLAYINSGLISDFFDKKELASAFSRIVWSVIPLSMYMTLGFFFQGIKKVFWLQVSQNLGVYFLMLVILSCGALLNIEFNLKLISNSYLISSISIFFLLYLFWQGNLAGRFDFGKINILKQAFPLWGGKMMAVLLQWLGGVLLGLWATSSDVAVYTVVYRVALLVGLILMAVNSISTPVFSEQFSSGNIQGLKENIKKSGRLTLKLSAPLIISVFIFSDWIVGLYGPSFEFSGGVLRLLIISQIFNIVTGPVGALLVVSGGGRHVFYSAALSVLIMIISSYLLIPSYGVMGAAISQSLALIFQMSFSTYAVCKFVGFSPVKVILSK